MATFAAARAAATGDASVKQQRVRAAISARCTWPRIVDLRPFEDSLKGMSPDDAYDYRARLRATPWNPDFPTTTLYADWVVAVAEEFRCERTAALFTDPTSAAARRPVFNPPPFPATPTTPEVVDTQQPLHCSWCTAAAQWVFETSIVGAYCGCRACDNRSCEALEATREWVEDENAWQRPELPGCLYCAQVRDAKRDDDDDSDDNGPPTPKTRGTSPAAAMQASQADEEIEDFPEMPAGDMELIDALERDAVALQDKQDSGSSGEWMLAAPSMDDEPIKKDTAAAGFVANDATARRPCSIAGKGATTEPKPNLSKSVRVPTAKKVKVAGKALQRTSARLARRSKLGRRTTSTL